MWLFAGDAVERPTPPRQVVAPWLRTAHTPCRRSACAAGVRSGAPRPRCRDAPWIRVEGPVRAARLAACRGISNHAGRCRRAADDSRCVGASVAHPELAETLKSGDA